MRDFLAATRDRVIVFDGGMGATLEQFDLDLERDYKLPGRCHEALVLNRPDVIQGVHESMVEAGAEVVETDTFQGSRLKLEEWVLGEHTLEINRGAAEIARKAVGEDRFVAGSIGPTGYLPASEDPSLGQIRFRELVGVFAQQAQGLLGEDGHELAEADLAEARVLRGGQVARRADRAGHEAVLADGLAGDLGRLAVDLVRVLAEPPLLQLDPGALEGVGLHDLGTGLDHGLVDALDDVGPVEDERLVAAAGKAVVALEIEIELLEGGAHATVEDDDAVAGRGEEVTHPEAS